MSAPRDAQAFILAILAHLREQHHLSWVISPKDFDLLRNWSEQEIPLPRLLEVLDLVVARRIRAGKPITTLSTFSYQVEKCRKSMVEEQSGSHQESAETPRTIPSSSASDPRTFLDQLPTELEPLKDLLSRLLLDSAPSDADRAELCQALLERFGQEPWVETRTAAFLRALPSGFAPQTWSDRYRVNLLLQHFQIPI